MFAELTRGGIAQYARPLAVVALMITGGVAQCQSRQHQATPAPASPVVAPQAAAAPPFTHRWRVGTDCELEISANDPGASMPWQRCPQSQHGCRQIEFAPGHGPAGPSIIGGPVAGFDAGTAVVGLDFGTQHVVLRGDGRVALTVRDGGGCQLGTWTTVGSGQWTAMAGTSPDPHQWYALSGPLELRASSQLTAQTGLSEADWSARMPPRPPATPCRLEAGTPPTIQRDGRSHPVETPPIGPTEYLETIAGDCDSAVVLVMEPVVSAGCMDMPGCGARVKRLVIAPVVP